MVRNTLEAFGMTREQMKEPNQQIVVPAPRKQNNTFKDSEAYREALFIGDDATSWDPLLQKKAEELEEAAVGQGEGREDLTPWKQTGLLRGVDNEWRREIADNEAFLKVNPSKTAEGKEYALSEVLSHPQIFTEYPQLNDTKVTFFSPVGENEGVSGYFDRSRNTLALSTELSPEEALSTALHEVQHNIQAEEGWTTGGNTSLGAREFNEAFNILKNYGIRDIETEANKEKEAYEKALEVFEATKSSWLMDIQRFAVDALYSGKPLTQKDADRLGVSLEGLSDYVQMRREADKTSVKDPNYFPLLRKRRDLKNKLFTDSTGLQEPQKPEVTVTREELEEALKLFKANPSSDVSPFLQELRQEYKVGNQIPDISGLNLLDSKLPLWHETYRRFGGEAEARNVQSRMGMTSQELPLIHPDTTLDVPRRQQQTGHKKYAEGGLVSKNAMSDYFMASSGQMSEMEFVGKHKMSTKEFEDRFESENNVDISGAEDIKEIVGKPKGNDMNKQMSFFNEGGMASPRVDPVSGNDVPIGSRPEEVRDDIDAKLSEGEYVVPADVVRFFGVNFFEQLRDKAKNGLQEMAADDRIGGAPAPQQGSALAPEDMQAITQMAEGGLVDSTNINGIIDRVVEAAKTNPELQGIFQKRGIMMAEGGLVGDLPSADEAAQSTFDPNQWSTVGANMGGASGSGYGYKQYYSPEGVPMMVLLINGLPAQTIPEGYTTTKPPEVKPSVSVEPRTGQDSPSFSGGAPGGSESGSLFNPLGNLDFSDPSSVSKDISKRLSGGTNFSGAGSAVGGLGGALIGGGISAYGKFRDIAVANAALRVAEDKGDLALAEDLAEQIRAAEEDFGLSGLARPEWFDGSQLYEDYQKNQGINPETGEPLKASERAARLAPDAGTGGGARSMAGATARSRQLEEQYGGDTGNRRTVEKDGVEYVQTGGRSDEPDTFSTRVATGSTAPTSSARPQSRPGMNKGGLVARRYKK